MTQSAQFRKEGEALVLVGFQWVKSRGRVKVKHLALLNIQNWSSRGKEYSCGAKDGRIKSALNKEQLVIYV